MHTLVARKYYMDELYEDVIVRARPLRRRLRASRSGSTRTSSTARSTAPARVTRRAGDALRWVQSGSVQAYGTVGFAGLLVAAFLMLVLVER